MGQITDNQINEHRLLVIDDDIAIGNMLCEIGQNCGYDSHKALEITEFETLYNHLKPNFIILDLSIGDRDGVEILRFLSQSGCTCPIILMSGHEDRVRASAFRLGKDYNLNMLTHMQKPVDIEVLMGHLDKSKEIKPFINKESIAKAIASNELRVYYQPVINLKTKKLIGVEALVRWQPPNQPLIMPDSFIKIAEEFNLIIPMTMWIIEEVFKQCAIWANNNLSLNVSINLSAKLLVHIDFPDDVMDLAKKHGVDPSKICFEVTETGVMAQPKIATDILTRLRVKGFSLSLDDFGIGYSSLVELYRMPFREIKIDKSFVLKMAEDHECYNIVLALIGLGHSLKLDVVAEGIETEEAWDHLHKLGCDRAQGFYMGRPVPPADIFNMPTSYLD